MLLLKNSLLIVSWTFLAITASAQTGGNADRDAEELKIAALEALVSAPPERALPIALKVLNGNQSDAVKSRALFVLSQIDSPEARAMLVDTATNQGGKIRLEAIRMIGISGNPDALARLPDIYRDGDASVRKGVLEAYLIADDSEAVYQVAVNAADNREFDAAVNILGAMNAREKLRQLRDRPGSSESLIEAYAIAGDFASLRELALDNSAPDRQAQALHGLGVVGGSEANTTLLEVYKNSDSAEVRDAALQGLLISDDDEGVLQLFRDSNDPDEKKRLLRTLVMLDSAAVFDIVDATLNGAP
jgi:HEAT repeat protein